MKLFILFLAATVLTAAEHRGRVQFGGLPLPGATITVTAANKTAVAISGLDGSYSFADLAAGVWTLRVEMQCFAPVERDVIVDPAAPPAEWELSLLPLEAMKAAPPRQLLHRPAPPIHEPAAAAPEVNQQAAEGFLINGSINNGDSSIFSLAPAFGNNRKGPASMYNGNLGLIAGNSALDARPFSFTGQDTPKPAYNRLTGVFSFGGPLNIPRLMPNGPNFVVNYQWTRDRLASTQPGRVPTEAERSADFASPQAKALLNFYPLPNFDGGARYNYQVSLTGANHQDSLQTRLLKTLGRRDQLSGAFAYQSTRSDSENLFHFLDTTEIAGSNTSVNWRHNLTTRLSFTLGYQYSRLATRVTPYFANRTDVSGQAGITGNNRDPINWGPPTLIFSSGIATLTDANASFTRNQTHALSIAGLWNRGRHNLSMGGDVRRQQFNLLSQQDPRGTFAFTGASGASSDFAGFLLGIPDTSSIAFGNADKYFRAWANDAYIADDWRISPGITVNAGLRWEYTSPIVEKYGRLVNLDLAPGFAAASPVVARDPLGPLTGRKFPSSLIHPGKNLIEPRVAISWRPLPASSLVVRAGYGVYANTSVYQAIATQMAQQSPLSKSLSVQNSPSNPLTLANAFNAASSTPNTFAVDPDFRVGYAHNWQLSIQRDLPAALVMSATYTGIKGTRGVQEFLPNTYPTGAVNPCPACPAGFAYLASNGNSTRESGQFQLRRRLHAGFTASLQYTFSKSIDDAALGGRGQGGSVIAQDWLNLRGERALSNFDQRHTLSAMVQYTTGMGLAGGALAGGRIRSLLKEWTAATQINAASGLPLTPVYLAAVNGTGVTGSIRPDYTGAPLYDAPPGLFLNPAAYVAPTPGHWGNAGRNSITGPSQFTLNASLGRTFRIADRFSLDFRADAANALNHTSFVNWNTTVTSAQFGLATAANPMRSVQTTLRVRF